MPTPSFMGLGLLPGGENGSWADAVSADGSTIVGSARTVGNQWVNDAKQAFRWSEATGMVSLGDFPSGGFFSEAVGVSSDGSTIVGRGSLGPFGPGDLKQAFRWTQQSGFVGLGYLATPSRDSRASGVAGDGTTIVGYSESIADDHQAFSWTSTLGTQPISTSPHPPFALSEASGISGDGLTIVGFANIGDDQVAFRQSSANGLQLLGDFPGGANVSYSYGVSAHGDVVVGYSQSAAGAEAFRWTQLGGLQSLGDLPGGQVNSVAYGVSADGSVIVGQSSSASSSSDAFIWDSVHGMRSLASVVTSELGISLAGWTLTEARGISADGTVIVGHGFNPNGYPEAFRVVLPEPSTGGPFLFATFLLARRRCHQRVNPLSRIS